MYVSVVLRVCLLYLSHYCHLAVHPRERRFYSTTKHHFSGCIWKMTYTQQWSAVAYAPSMGLKWSVEICFNISSFLDTLQFVAIDILGPFPKVSSARKHVFIMRIRYSKVTPFIPNSEITLTRLGTYIFRQLRATARYLKQLSDR